MALAAKKDSKKFAWADVEEDDVAGGFKASLERFETPVDAKGIKTITEYKERDGATIKVIRKVQTETVKRTVNKNAVSRNGLGKFGKEVAEECKAMPVQEDVPIEAVRRQLGVVQDELDRFYEQEADVQIAAKREGPVGAWTSNFRRRDDEGKEGEGKDQPDPRINSNAYIPPSLRAGAKGAGKGDARPGEEFTLRVTNLSEDVREGDLQGLFGAIGWLQRVYVAKDQETGQSRGFAFVTYHNRHDAERAIEKLHGHGYDNLILSVQFAKPRAT